ncbi:hypothetical protein BDY19DRAFT_997036 [Irpex rosettiformis]|uniref:Uncharacterized protein n=1 Tax=Irpex rosettiformis TaxID=378272 RepID=A0ACB8TTI6_9APHY|nr:hypothetical protein BDY19DRAFT_997036 [Irpex rosettiformis]
MSPSLAPRKPHLKRGEAPCYAWRAGSCTKGTKCFFAHDPEVQAAERRRQEAAARRARAQQEKCERRAAEAARMARLADEAREQAHRERLAQEEAARQAEQRRSEQARLREEQEKELFTTTAKEEAARTIQQVILGSIVTCAAGFDVRAIVTGFDSCTVVIRNLPLDAREDEIRGLFTQQGIDPDRLLLTSVKRTQDGKQEATIVTDAEHGEVLAIGLDTIEFRNERLAFEVGVCNVAGGMGAGYARDTDILTISWRAPSVRYIGACDSMDIVHAKVWELNGRVLHGRKVKVEINTPPPSRFIRNFNPVSIKISNLPPDISLADLHDFTGLTNLQCLRNNLTWTLENGLRLLREDIEKYNLSAFTCSVPSVNLDGIVSVRAQFRSHEDAKDAYDYLEEAKSLYYLNAVAPWFRLPAPHTYTLTIPYLQYESQRRIWHDLKTSIEDKKACDIVIQEQEGRGSARIRVLGSLKPAVGALKVRVESLAGGEKVDGWNPALAKADSAFVRSLFADTGTFLRGDWTRKQLKLYGEPKAVEAAREEVKRELDRLSSLERTIHLTRQSVGFFIRQGLSELQAILGDECAALDPTRCTITVSGGEEARHHLDRLLTQSRTSALPSLSVNGQTCPICMDDITAPVRIGCGHSYCAACLRHYLLSALDSDTFPLVCIGDESRCEVPIALPAIQRLLPPASFNRLLEVAFTNYVSKHPQELVYCKTPDCTQIYRTTQATSPSVLQCPSCFSTVCSGCNEDSHEGMSCAESRLHKDPEAQDRAAEEWIRSQGNRIKRCPQCNIHIEKTEGCNHMTCRCGAHVCWICLGVFTREDIYDHMQNAHGGIYTADPATPEVDYNPFHGVDYAEQEAALRQAQAARVHQGRAREAREREARARAFVLEMRRQEDAERLGRDLRRAAYEEATRRRLEEDRRRMEEAQRQQETRDGGGWCVLM